MKQKHLDNIEIFKDTVALVEKGQVQTNSKTFKHTFNDINKPIGRKGKLTVWDKSSVCVLQELPRSERSCILNMASKKTAGGGVRKGYVAQEESLFRSSNLFETIVQDFYPLQDDECLYTVNATFFKDFYYNRMKPLSADVITVAAINLNENSRFDKKTETWIEGLIEKPENYEEITKQKIRLMLSLCQQYVVDNIILGAWGCGVFKNDPYEMARMFKEVIEEGYGINVHFAIINDKNSVANNVDIFTKVLTDEVL